MTLRDLAKVLPAYTMMYVHDSKGKFACKGNPHEFTVGLYKSHAADVVSLANPIDFYRMEITVAEVGL